MCKFTFMDKLATSPTCLFAGFWTAGGNWRTLRKPAETRRQHARRFTKLKEDLRTLEWRGIEATCCALAPCWPTSFSAEFNSYLKFQTSPLFFPFDSEIRSVSTPKVQSEWKARFALKCLAPNLAGIALATKKYFLWHLPTLSCWNYQLQWDFDSRT